MAKIPSEAVLDALRSAGLADDNTRRVVIDIRAGQLPVVYVEKYGDDNVLQVIDAVSRVEVRHEPSCLGETYCWDPRTGQQVESPT